MKNIDLFKKMVCIFLCIITLFSIFIPIIVNAEMVYDENGEADPTKIDWWNDNWEDEPYIGTKHLQGNSSSESGWDWYIVNTDEIVHATEAEIAQLKSIEESTKEIGVNFIFRDITYPANEKYYAAFLNSYDNRVQDTIQQVEENKQRDLAAEGFYVNEKEELDNLFSLTKGDIVNPIAWITDTHTFVVVKKYTEINEDTKEEKTRHKIYVNVPNVQQYVKNLVLGLIPDGYENKTYIPSSKFVANVGPERNEEGLLIKDSSGKYIVHDENVLSKFGFNLPLNRYTGEYPRVTMSLTNIIPTSFWDTIWRGLKALFGFSVLNAPDAENFKTLSYFGNEYLSSKNEKLIQFVRENWLLFEKYLYANGKGNMEYFSGPKEVQELAVTEDQYAQAVIWIAENTDKIVDAYLTKMKREAFLQLFKEENMKEAIINSIEIPIELPKIPTQNVETPKMVKFEKYPAYENAVKVYNDNIKKYNEPIQEEGTYYRYSPAYTTSYIVYTGSVKNWDSEVFVETEPVRIGYNRTRQKWLKVAEEMKDITDENLAVKVSNAAEYVETDSEGNYLPGTSYIPNDWVYPYWGNFVGDYIDSLNETENYKPLTKEQQSVIETFERHTETIEKYNRFNTLMKNGTTQYENEGQHNGLRQFFNMQSADFHIFYNQCLLNNFDEGNGDSKEGCIKYYNNKETSGLLYDLYVRTNVYQLTENLVFNKDYKLETVNGIPNIQVLSRKKALAILSKIQQTFGPAYNEVMTNLIILIQYCAGHEYGEEFIKAYDYIDPRVMPYDVDTLQIEKDLTDIIVRDNRVEIYKNSNLIGGTLTDGFDFTLIISQFFNATNLYSGFIGFGGVLTQFACFLNDWCNFQFFEDLGLSPTTMWTTFASSTAIGILMVLMIISVVIYAFKYIKGRAGIAQILGRVGFFLLMLAVIIMLTVSPNETYGTIKKASNTIFNLGESLTITNNNLKELYGKDNNENLSVTYYIPYFNLWTYFNTGYSLADESQVINKNDGTPEVEKIMLPKIDGVETKLWPVVLADSFNAVGINEYDISRGGYNGKYINANAYRVVDHFLAPRLSSNNPAGGKLDITNVQNENYNGQFQNPEFFTVLCYIMSIINVFILSLIKFLTFLWFWWMLYTFVFNVLLNSGASISSRGGLKTVLIKTFSPVLFIILIGAYTGAIVDTSLRLNGILGFFAQILLLALTSIILNAWSKSQVFPATIKPIMFILHPFSTILGIKENIAQRKRENEQHRMGHENRDDILNEDGTWTGEALNNPEARLRLIKEISLEIKQGKEFGEFTHKEQLLIHRDNILQNTYRKESAKRQVEAEEESETFEGD